VPVLLLANVFLGIYINQSIWYKLSGQTRFGAYIAVVGAVFTITLNIIFIPLFGYIACAWVTLLVYGGQMIASYLLGQKHYPIPYNLRKFGLYIIVALVFYGLLTWINIQPGWTQFIVHNLFILLFVALVWFMEKPRKATGNSL
jgi:O-antigen/teichoic acid export membrane protein